MVLKIDLRDQSIEHLQFPSHRLGPSAAIALLEKAIPNRLVPHHRETDQVENHAGGQIVTIEPLRRHAGRRQSSKTRVAEQAANRPAGGWKRRSRLKIRFDWPKPGSKMKPFVRGRVELVDSGSAQAVKQKIESATRQLFHSGNSPDTDRFAQRDLFNPGALASVDHRHGDRIGPLKIPVAGGEAAFHHLPVLWLENVQRLCTMWQQRHAWKREERDGLSEINTIRGHRPNGSPPKGVSANQILKISGRGEQFSTLTSDDRRLCADRLETQGVEAKIL
jgi:hypothetical protein